MTRARLPLELALAAYLVAWIPYIALTKGLASLPLSELGRPLAGLEILPSSLILLWLLTYAFLFASGWSRNAAQARVGGRDWPRPRPWTALAGVGAGLLLLSVPLSFTFRGVSIPFVQLLMRGDVLLIAPLVDLISRRRVQWWSWVALVLVGAGMAITLRQRGGLNLPGLAILTVGVYCLGYLVRLTAMSRVAKTAEPGSLKRYYVEEQLVATPFAILGVAAIGFLGHGPQADQIRWGFAHAWSSAALPYLVAIALLSFVQSVLAARILLDPMENAFCVAMERSGSVLGGLAAAYVLSRFFAQPAPTGAELTGALLLIAAVALLSVAPRLASRRRTVDAALRRAQASETAS
jgi:hypothetical protein